MPKELVDTEIGDETFLCTIAFKNELPAEAWKGVEKPPGFLGPKWPPETVADLLGCSTLTDTCIECTFGNAKIVDGKQYLRWSARMYDFWLDNIRPYRISDEVGCGLKAWRDIPKHTCIGEYTGELVPHDKVSNEETQYHYQIDIGPVGANGTQTTCWPDATYIGSIFRFMNHKCNPTASVEHGRCGMHNRIMYVYTLRDIKKGEDIMISYGPKWFSQPTEPCFCGLRVCKNPPKKKEDKKKKDGKGEKKNDRKPKGPETQNGKRDQRGSAKDADDKHKHNKVAANSQLNMHSASAQTRKHDKRSSETSEPTQPRRSGGPSRATSPPRRRSPRLSQKASRSSSPSKHKSSRLSPDPSNRVSKQAPRRGPVGAATGGEEARKGPKIRQKTCSIPKGQKKPGAK